MMDCQVFIDFMNNVLFRCQITILLGDTVETNSLLLWLFIIFIYPFPSIFRVLSLSLLIGTSCCFTAID